MRPLLAALFLMWTTATAAQEAPPSDAGVHAMHEAYQEMMSKNGYNCPCSSRVGECRPAKLIFPTLKTGEKLSTVIVDLGEGFDAHTPMPI